MAGTLLLVLTSGFDDMAFLSNQVLLVEAGNDVIIASRTSDAVKGQDSSVMTVALSEALEQAMDYRGLIIVGGNGLDNWGLLTKTITEFNDNSKIIGAIENGIGAIENAGLNISMSQGNDVIVSDNVISLQDPTNVEEFVEQVIEQLG